MGLAVQQGIWAVPYSYLPFRMPKGDKGREGKRQAMPGLLRGNTGSGKARQSWTPLQGTGQMDTLQAMAPADGINDKSGYTGGNDHARQQNAWTLSRRAGGSV